MAARRQALVEAKRQETSSTAAAAANVPASEPAVQSDFARLAAVQLRLDDAMRASLGQPVLVDTPVEAPPPTEGRRATASPGAKSSSSGRGSIDSSSSGSGQRSSKWKQVEASLADATSGLGLSDSRSVSTGENWPLPPPNVNRGTKGTP